MDIVFVIIIFVLAIAYAIGARKAIDNWIEDYYKDENS